MILRSETDKLFRQLENTRTSLIWADSYWQGFPERVQQLKTRIVELDVIVADLQQEQESVLTDMARDYLTELDERLTLYLAQARLALARLYDDSLQQEFGSEPVTSSAESARDVKASTPEQTDKEAE